MVVAVMPDVIKLVRSYLMSLTAVTNLVGERIATRAPQDTSSPWVKIERVGGPRSLSAPMRLETARVQVSSYAPATADTGLSGDEGAMTLARTVQAALIDAAGWSDDEGVIAYVSEPLGPQNLPDTSRTPPTPRVVFTHAFLIRPL